MSTKIAVVNSAFKDEHKKLIESVATKYGASVDFYSTNDEAIPNLKGVEILFGFGAKLPEAAPDLKWFCTSSAGIDLYTKSPAFDDESILFSNSSGSYGLPISEHIIMMSLELMRRMPEYQKLIDARGWTRDYLPIKTLYGSRIVVLGTGDLGKTFADRVASFLPETVVGISKSGKQVEGFDQVFSFAELKAASGSEPIIGAAASDSISQDAVDELKGILKEADLLVMCLPGAPGTENTLNDDLINALSDSVYVVNVGRGSAVDEDAIVEALNQGRIAGAALDVFKTEPLPEDSPLWSTPGLLVTPHISGQEVNPWTVMNNAAMFAEDLENYFEGRPLAHAADLKAGY